MPDILANGIRIHYEERGTGPAMVWAHGLGGTWQGWERVMDFFQGRYRVIAYDARGHGRSEIPARPEAYSQDIMVQDLLGVMDALGVGRAIVGGHSMGANVALNFALQYPERCLGLIAVGIGSGSSDPEWWREYWGRLADLAEKQGMAAFLEEMKKVPAWASAFALPGLGEEISRTVLNNSPGGIARTIRGVQKERPSIFALEPKLEKLSVPTLVVMSQGDAPVAECSRFMAQRIPGAVLEVIPARSHWTHLEAVEEFLSAVDRFARRL
ncbi:MAG TPA: alpha/beta hydrolase [Dehalococcoidia bacterium]|jgi:pimeloyl-ACP methyl ester carboxylesterase|nr:alpha/beta hydrolase [Dehalococcoidia bacterium]